MSAVSVPCPSCGRETAADVVADDSVPLPAHFPFCTERCRLIDLGKWFNEEFKVSRPADAQGRDLPDDTDSG